MNLPVDIDIPQIIGLAQKAGDAIMKIYTEDYNVQKKLDESPLTKADLSSHEIIVQGLRELTPNIPTLSEESPERDIKNRVTWKTYWLVDPLDGTKEFIKKNGEFTVNIALIHQNKTVFGVVNAPALDVTYWGGRGVGAYKLKNGIEKKIKVATKKKYIKDIKIVGSRSHQCEEFYEFIADYPGASVSPIGSSLKLCLVAEGFADLYPRFGPTSEWDTAAAQSIVEGAGGTVVSLVDRLPLKYNTKFSILLNPKFLASS
jgi:3'(2'), 5'-bisphosphate nucleotidase